MLSDPGQAANLARTFGCVRLVYNKALDARTKAWYRRKERVGYVETSALLTKWKRRKYLARKQRGSKNYRKAQVRLARAHARISDRRHDFLHKLTTRLVRENQVIAVEDLGVRGMLSNRTLARAIADASWAAFRRMLEYKTEWYGRNLVAVDRFFPSSKTCSACGTMKHAMPLGERTFACADCGHVECRDVNAAKNILAAGLAVAACGDGVRPKRS
ncbi:hypothetical protein GCM10029992_43980 [Glycomyces albus]